MKNQDKPFDRVNTPEVTAIQLGSFHRTRKCELCHQLIPANEEYVKWKYSGNYYAHKECFAKMAQLLLTPVSPPKTFEELVGKLTPVSVAVLHNRHEIKKLIALQSLLKGKPGYLLEPPPGEHAHYKIQTYYFPKAETGHPLRKNPSSWTTILLINATLTRTYVSAQKLLTLHNQLVFITRENKVSRIKLPKGWSAVEL